MDLETLFFDRALLRTLCGDAARGVRALPPQKPLYGEQPLEDQADGTASAAMLDQLAQNEEVLLWELQWATLTLIYLSDALAAALHEGTDRFVFERWYCGGDGLMPFNQRYERNMSGQYEPHKKRGQRKAVLHVAKTPLEAAADEVLLLHMIKGQRHAHAVDSCATE